LNGKPFIAYYVEALLKDKKLEFTTQALDGVRIMPSAYYTQENNPLLIVNGTFFNLETNQNLNLVIQKKKLLSYNVTSLKGPGADSTENYYVTRSAIGISKKRRADVAWTFTDSNMTWVYAFQDSPVVAKGKSKKPTVNKLGRYDWRKWRMVTAIGGGPTLIHNGKIRITNKEEQMQVGGEIDKHPRTAMGYTSDGRLIILVIEGRNSGIAEGATLQDEANILLRLGCYEALNLDGGGSSCMLINGKETIKPSDKEGERPVPGVFMIRQKHK
jgi:exopolysaccharide biosynthesis protein